MAIRAVPANGAAQGAGDRGFALLVVLWAVVLLTFLAAQLTAAGRTELQLAANLRAAAAAEAVADGVIHQALFHVLDPVRPWPADGAVRTVQAPGGQAVLRIENEGGRINPNTAPPELLRALLRRVGADSRTADGVAAAIVDWRFPGSQGQPGGAKEPQYRAAGRPYGPAGAPFRSVEEVGAVLGMTPGLLSRLSPSLSVLTEGDPDLAAASPVVRQAIQDIQRNIVAPSRPQPLRVVTITARVNGDAGARFARRAVVRLGVTEREPLFNILTWEIVAE